MDQLYHQTNRIIQEIQQNFQQLNGPQGDRTNTEYDIQTKIAMVNA